MSNDVFEARSTVLEHLCRKYECSSCGKSLKQWSWGHVDKVYGRVTCCECMSTRKREAAEASGAERR